MADNKDKLQQDEFFDLEEDAAVTEYLISMLHKIFDPLPVPLILLDKNGIIRMINQVFADFLRYPKEEIIGKYVLDVDKYSRFPYVLRTKKAEIAWKHTFENGHTAIVHRIPS